MKRELIFANVLVGIRGLVLFSDLWCIRTQLEVDRR